MYAGAREKAKAGRLAFGTVDTWLIWKLTGGKVHVTDVTNASRTMLFNINTLSWDKDLLEIFNIPESVLPDVAHLLRYMDTLPKVFSGTHTHRWYRRGPAGCDIRTDVPGRGFSEEYLRYRLFYSVQHRE